MTEGYKDYNEYSRPGTDQGYSAPLAPDTGRRPERPGKKGGAGLVVLSVLLLLALIAIPMVGFVCYQIGAARGQTTVRKSASGSGVDNQAIVNKLQIMEGLVNEFFLYDMDSEKVETGIYKGFVSGLDDAYAEYYTASDYKKLMEEDSGKYQGIGVTVMKDTVTNYVKIESIFKNTPAEEAGLKANDYIISVNDKDTQSMTLQEVVSEIRRDDKENAVLVINREGEELTFDIKKTKVVIESVDYKMLDGNIGYIEVTQFLDNTDEAFIEAVDDLEGQKMKGLIIDLRDDGGGLVDSCVNMVSRIIPRGKMVTYTETKSGQRDEYKSNSDKTLSLPMVILINGNTASASEIFTGCLKDYNLAQTVGVKSFGKGIVQSVIPMGDGTALKFTVSKYYSPNGTNIHETGIEPDVKVEMTDEQIEAARDDSSKDLQLNKAIEMLK